MLKRHLTTTLVEREPTWPSGFIDALQVAYRVIGDHPAAGSTLHANELGFPGLRSRISRRCPYLVFYVERDDHIDVWRVLHAHRDIPAWMREPGADDR